MGKGRFFPMGISDSDGESRVSQSRIGFDPGKVNGMALLWRTLQINGLIGLNDFGYHRLGLNNSSRTIEEAGVE